MWPLAIAPFLSSDSAMFSWCMTRVELCSILDRAQSFEASQQTFFKLPNC